MSVVLKRAALLSPLYAKASNPTSNAMQEAQQILTTAEVATRLKVSDATALRNMKSTPGVLRLGAGSRTRPMMKEQDWKKVNDLAESILNQLDEVWVGKLKEFKTELLEVRAYFQQKKRRNILGCETWAAFCQEKLHRTKRAVNMMLAEPKPEREVSSHPESDEQLETPDPSTEGPIVADADEPDAAEDDWEKAKDATQKKLRHQFSPLDSVESIAEKFTEILQGLMPTRRLIVTVKEIREEVAAKGKKQKRGGR